MSELVTGLEASEYQMVFEFQSHDVMKTQLGKFSRSLGLFPYK